MKRLAASLAVVVLVPTAGLSGANTSVDPSEPALDLARRLRATRMGVDHKGNLWTWTRSNGRVVVYSPTGSLLESTTVSGVYALAADAEWGIAALESEGSQLRLFNWNVPSARSIDLGREAKSLAWIDPTNVAVAPANAAHRVEIWNLKEGALAATLGTEKVLKVGPGMTRLRGVDLLYSQAEDLLYTIETFTGELQVFTLAGERVRRAQIHSPLRAGVEEWLQTGDQKARQENDIQTPLVVLLWLAVDSRGSSWIVQECRQEEEEILLSQVLAEGTVRAHTVSDPCCSHRGLVWGEWLILYQAEDSSPDQCNSLRRLPS